MAKKNKTFNSLTRAASEKILGKKNTRLFIQNKNAGLKALKALKPKPVKIKRVEACGRYRRQRDQFQKDYAKNVTTINDLTNQKNTLIDYADRCKKSNNQLIKKNNLLLDTTQYLNDQLFGAFDSAKNFTTGYVRSFMDAVYKKNNMLDRQIGQGAINENFEIIENIKGACDKYKRQRDDIQNKVNKQTEMITKLRTDTDDLKSFKNKCTNRNSILIKKNNALLDTSQYFEQQINGDNGFINKLMNEQTEINDILSKERGSSAEGFDSIYNTINSQNNIIQNQIKINEDQHSIDNQNYINLSNQIDLLNRINEITGWILFAVIIISATIIWFSTSSFTHRLVMVKVVWLYLIIIEILEYVLFYAYIYARSILFGEQATYKDYWKFPTLTWVDICILILIVLSVFI
jgi:uncharacterized phage infection (PIP) family protein YhgE